MFTTSHLPQPSQLREDVTVSTSYLGQVKIFLGVRRDGEEEQRETEHFFVFVLFCFFLSCVLSPKHLTGEQFIQDFSPVFYCVSCVLLMYQ